MELSSEMARIQFIFHAATLTILSRLHSATDYLLLLDWQDIGNDAHHKVSWKIDTQGTQRPAQGGHI